MITASALRRHCGYAKVLSNRPPVGAKEIAARDRRDEAAARGTIFHAAIEAWVKTGTPGVVADPEIQGWIDLLAMQWAPPPGSVTEEAWGLSPEGDYVHVLEPEPHVYVSVKGEPLLTAGRSDISWPAPGTDPHRPIYVLDWKTGKWPVTPPAANLQINAAGISHARGLLASTYVPGIYYTRDGVFEWGEPVELGSLAHAQILADVMAAALLDEQPRPGPHCNDCWERKACAHALTEAA